MSFSIQNIIPRVSAVNFKKQAKSNVNNNPKSLNNSQNDSFEMSVGYINDVHGQTNNMMRILSGLKGDIKFSAGDNDIGDEKNESIHKATAEFLNQAEVNASAMGNHELDMKQENLIKMSSNLKTQILSSNLKKVDNWQALDDNLETYGRADIDKHFANSTIVEVKGEKIGVIGISPIDMFDRTTHPNYHKDCYVETLENTLDIVQNEIDILKNKGINKIFVLSHLGNAKDKIIAPQLDGVDVIIGGHTHELIKDIKEGENLLYSKSGEPIILTEAGKDGAYFGLLNLTFDENGVITKAQNNIAETRLFAKNMANQAIFDKIIGKPEEVGVIKSAPIPPKTLIEENPHANFVCDAMKHVTNSEIAIWNNGGIRNFFHEGIIDSRDIKDIAPFLDRISVANVSEKKIVDMFKRAIYETCTTHSNKPGLLAVSGLNYSINKETGELLAMNFVDSNGNEIPIDVENPNENKFYKLVTDEFMMSADADYAKLADESECLEIYPYDKDVMTCQYIKELNTPIVINQTGRIKFVK